MFDGKTLDGWEVVGDGFWAFMSDGTLLGERRPSREGPGGETMTRAQFHARRDLIRVKVNGVVVAEHAGDPKRPRVGPIGLQLHDQFSVIQFRNVRIRER